MDEKNQEPDSMCETVYHYFNQKYGMKKMADKQLARFVVSMSKFKKQPRVNVFQKFITL